MSTAFDYWASGRGLSQITPRKLAWPEGDDFPGFITRLIDGRTVLEFGCGPGRLARLFGHGKYIGVDICEKALHIARSVLPLHRFELIDEHCSLPDADVTLAHTVLLHVPDDKLRPTVSRFRSGVVYVSEILGAQWRHKANPPAFNRELQDYRAVFEPEYRLANVAHRLYPYYANTHLSILAFVKNEP